jgi:hypothetical protein
VAVLPCCHELENNDLGGLEGWMDHGCGQGLSASSARISGNHATDPI